MILIVKYLSFLFDFMHHNFSNLYIFKYRLINVTNMCILFQSNISETEFPNGYDLLISYVAQSLIKYPVSAATHFCQHQYSSWKKVWKFLPAMLFLAATLVFWIFHAFFQMTSFETNSQHIFFLHIPTSTCAKFLFDDFSKNTQNLIFVRCF